MRISKRLLKCAEYVSPYRKVADVGTDHALLPIYLIEANIADKVIASDVRKGPINAANRNILESNTKDKIEIVLSDGIEHIKEEVDCLIISGMGGKLISEILNHDNLNNITRLILQPNVASNILRAFLQEKKFKILKEEIIIDNDLVYEILVCERGEMKLSEKEFIFGPFLIKEKSELFISHWVNELEKLEKVLLNVPVNHENYNKLVQQVYLIKEVLHETN
ncbi:class I SAM-dependent methyltransferase [Mycoplasmatota bacterium WC44]